MPKVDDETRSAVAFALGASGSEFKAGMVTRFIKAIESQGYTIRRQSMKANKGKENESHT